MTVWATLGPVLGLWGCFEDLVAVLPVVGSLGPLLGVLWWARVAILGNFPTPWTVLESPVI